MPVIVNTPDGPVVVNELTGDVYGQKTLAALGGTSGPQVNPTPGADPTGPNVDPTGPTGSPATAQPQKRVVGTQALPNGDTQVSYEDGTFEVIPKAVDPLDELIKQASLQRQLQLLGGGSGSGGVSPTTAYSEGQANARSAANLAEQQRQFNEQFGMDKAKFNEQYQLDQGKTLLSLGSRPDTLTRYLYAIRGLQPPQALGGQGVTLPGFNNIFATPQSGAPAAPAQGATAGQAAPNLQTSVPGAPVQLGPSAPNASTNFGQTPGLTSLGQPGSTQYNGYNIPTPAGSASLGVLAKPLQAGPAVPGTSFTNADGSSGINVAANGSTAEGGPITGAITTQQAASGPKSTVMIDGKPVNIYKRGGLIPEPVVGRGLISGQKYVFGEEAPGKPEMVVPQGKTMKDVEHKSGEMMMPNMRGYAGGGTIGYDPNLFNPSSLPGIVARGYNSTPDVPLFPSVGIATGGGSSLIPSAQRYNSLLPSEQQSYSGFLQDEAGVQPDDISALAQKLAPKVRGLTTPRYV